MNAHTLNVLEYHDFLSLVANYAAGEPARECIRAFRPRASVQQAVSYHRLYGQLLEVLRKPRRLPAVRTADLAEVLRRLALEGSVLPGEDLVACAGQLEIAGELQAFLSRDDCRDLSELARLRGQLDPCVDVRHAIERTFDDEGSIVDGASDTLRRLRRQIRSLEEQIRRTLESMLNQTGGDDTFQDRFVTVRNGRYVIPVRREAKKRLPGVVHDHSDSGRTLFMEPTGTLPFGNDLADARLEERDECLRILAALSDRLRASLPALKRNQRAMIAFDVGAAVALWADDCGCELPHFGEGMHLRKVRHPLLQRRLRAERREHELVPLDLDLPANTKALVVTGSNSGGKTVAIKTVGLVSLIAQSGLPVPAGHGSQFRFFAHVFADIGDEQSLSENLSTFTGHLSRTTQILQELERDPTAPSLVLLDELGTGTDPLEGGALACAVLSELCFYNSLTVATTHLGAIKTFAHEHEQMVNGAVRFDLESLTPEYTLELGRPGASHALQIAERLGMRQTVLSKARQHLGSDQLKLEGMLAGLEEQQRLAEQQEGQTRRTLAELTRDRDQTRDELSELRRKRRQLLHEAYTQAEQIVANTRRRMEKVVGEIRQAEDRAAAERAARDARSQVAERQRTLAKAVVETAEKPLHPLDTRKLKTGDVVWVAKLGSNARVKSVTGGGARVRVTLNNVEFTVPAREVGRADEAAPAPEPPPPVQQRPRFSRQVCSELNLIGRRVDEALPLLEHFLCDAMMAGIDEVRVVHGYGTGRLMHGVHEYLSRSKLVAEFRLGEGDRDPGGAGATIVTVGQGG